MAVSVFRLFTLMEGLNRIIFSLIRGLDLYNYIMILMLVVQWFATFGQQTYGEVAPEYFQSESLVSYMTLFQLLLGEGWHEVMCAANHNPTAL